ncbi:MAG: hypothetical protein WB615_12450 [Candidatus Tumulicola sp.]
MTYEAIGAYSALGTFVVILATAIAALVQLRHLRQSNQLSGLLSVLQLFQDPHLHDLIDFVRTDLPRQMEDPEFVAGFERVPIDRKQHPEFHLAELYEEVGSFVRSGLVDEKLFLQGHWYNVLLYWKLLQPAIVAARKPRPYIFENFEYLALRAQAWCDRHPRGNYPASAPRMT